MLYLVTIVCESDDVIRLYVIRAVGLVGLVGLRGPS